jgi:hypothetical protein
MTWGGLAKRTPSLSGSSELATLSPMARKPRIGADRIVRSRFREPVHFQDLTERMTIRLSAVSAYTGRSHFAPWTRILASVHDHSNLGGIFAPLVYVEYETADVPCEASERIEVTGKSWLARNVDASGDTRNIAREGRHTLRNGEGTFLGSSRMVNVFTRYDPDPARRRVTELPADLGLGAHPSREISIPVVESMADFACQPDFADSESHVWHYGHTDPNRHVNGTAYLRAMEEFLADSLKRAGHDLARLYFARTRVVYRKPCFRGEGYRRAAWFRSEAPLTLTGAFIKEGDPTGSPTTAVELTLLQHS